MAPDDRATFILTYDGPALADGRMDVRDLAPALMSLGDLFQDANDLLNPESPPLNLEIRAFNEGSFEVNLDLVLQKIANLLTSTPTVAAVNLIQIIAGGRGLFRFLTRAGNRRIVEEQEDDQGGTTITFDDGTTVETDSRVVVLIKNEAARRHAKGVVAPLKREGVDELRMEAPDEPAVVVTDEESEALDIPGEEDLLTDEEWEMAATISSINFKPGTKWKLSDGSRTFWARIEDEAFLERVERAQESFSKGDILVSRIRQRQWQTPEGLKSEYVVLKVERHIPGAQDVQLPFVTDRGSEEPPALPE